MCPVANPWRGVISRYRDALVNDYVARNNFDVRIARPSKHESKAKKRERVDNTPLAVILGLADEVIQF